MALRLAVAGLLSALAVPARAQAVWPQGRTAALVLTYDDALRSQLEVAVPQPDGTGTRRACATSRSVDRLAGCRVRIAGHELSGCFRRLLPWRRRCAARRREWHRRSDYPVPALPAATAT